MTVQHTQLDIPATVRRAWEDCLDIRESALDDDFFALGGNSLHAAELMAELSERFGRRLRLALLIRHPTLRGLTAAVREVIEA
jgi:acyl carrier protein